jgi:hypothetical protein
MTMMLDTSQLFESNRSDSSEEEEGSIVEGGLIAVATTARKMWVV